LVEIEGDEHEEILEGLTEVVERDFGEVVVRVGINRAGFAVTLFATMAGKFGCACAIR
jgi:hypothetical protein